MSRINSASRRVLLQMTAKILQGGAALGHQIAALLYPETPVEVVTALLALDEKLGANYRQKIKCP